MSAPRPAEEVADRPAPLRVVRERGAIDVPAVERAVADLLAALGRDPASPHLTETPRRVVDSFAEMLTGPQFDVTTFPNDEGYNELVLATALPVRSLCEHHLLPFAGVAHIGYLPGDRLLGLSKLARVLDLVEPRPTPLHAVLGPRMGRSSRGCTGSTASTCSPTRPCGRSAAPTGTSPRW
jgi:GTP cyclohydrolase I